MPNLLTWKGFWFLFYSADGREPPHVHVRKGRQEAKFWLEDGRLEKARRLSEHEINMLQSKVLDHREEFLEKWHEFFGD